MPPQPQRIEELLDETAALNRITIDSITQRLQTLARRNETADSVAAQGNVTGRCHLAFQAKDRAAVEACPRRVLQSWKPSFRARYALT